MLSSGNKGFTMSSNVNSPVSHDAHCASSISDLRETHSHSDVSFGSMSMSWFSNKNLIYTSIMVEQLEISDSWMTCMKTHSEIEYY